MITRALAEAATRPRSHTLPATVRLSTRVRRSAATATAGTAAAMPMVAAQGTTQLHITKAIAAPTTTAISIMLTRKIVTTRTAGTAAETMAAAALTLHQRTGIIMRLPIQTPAHMAAAAPRTATQAIHAAVYATEL